MRRARRAAATGRLCAVLALLGGTALAGLAHHHLAGALATAPKDTADGKVCAWLPAIVAPRAAPCTDTRQLLAGVSLDVPRSAAPRPLLAEASCDEARARADGSRDAPSGSRRTIRNGCRVGGRCSYGRPPDPALVRDLRAALEADFGDVLEGAPEPAVVREELVAILLGAARRIPPERVWNSRENTFVADTDPIDIARLRRHVPDSIVRRLGQDLPRLLQERHLTAVLEMQVGGGCSIGAGPSDGCVMTLSRRAIVNGEVRVVERKVMSGNDDPRIADAHADVERREAEYRRAVEAIVGLAVFADAQVAPPAGTP